MLYLILFLASVAPVAVLLFYIYRKDKEQPEPPKWLWKGFLYGIASVFVSLLVSLPLNAILDLPETPKTIGQAVTDAFCLAAIPEEAAKLLMLWLLLRKNPYFDEYLDGVVYAVCVGMGFACFENILYVFENGLGTAVMRAFTSVPGHFLNAVIMGYFYSLYHFAVRRNIWTMVLILIAPVIAHGIYDTICYSALPLLEANELFAILIVVVFLYFMNKLRKYAQRSIAKLQELDRQNAQEYVEATVIEVGPGERDNE